MMFRNERKHLWVVHSEKSDLASELAATRSIRSVVGTTIRCRRELEWRRPGCRLGLTSKCLC
jgi:hypothetical protein